MLATGPNPHLGTMYSRPWTCNSTKTHKADKATGRMEKDSLREPSGMPRTAASESQSLYVLPSSNQCQ